MTSAGKIAVLAAMFLAPLTTAFADDVSIEGSGITPKIDENATNTMTGKTIDPLIQALAYADGVRRICDIKVPIELLLRLETGVNIYQIRHQGKTADDLRDSNLDYLFALMETGLINRDGSGKKSKKKKKKLCTKSVRTHLLSELELIADSKLDEVGFMRPLLSTPKASE